MATLKQVIDIDGTDIISKVLLDLLNNFPGIGTNEITFSSLSEDYGIGFFPTSGAVLISNTEDIAGNVFQRVSYPFNVIYRSAPTMDTQRIRIKEFLDMLGRWLEQQPVTINGVEYKLDSYPEITSGNRRIISIIRTNPSHLNAAYEDGIEDWMIEMSLQYSNEYNK